MSVILLKVTVYLKASPLVFHRLMSIDANRLSEPTASSPFLFIRAHLDNLVILINLLFSNAEHLAMKPFVLLHSNIFHRWFHSGGLDIL